MQYVQCTYSLPRKQWPKLLMLPQHINPAGLSWLRGEEGGSSVKINCEAHVSTDCQPLFNYSTSPFAAAK
ncbi:hypothetical protein EV2_017060 [Malus domestica]